MLSIFTNKYVQIGLIALAMIVAIIAGIHAIKSAHDAANNNLLIEGQTQEQLNEQNAAIDAIETANNAVEHPSSDQLNSVCAHYDRNCNHGS